MEYNIAATQNDFYFKYLTSIRGVLDLSSKERMVLGEFMKIQEYLDLKNSDISPFSSDNRKLVRKSLNMSSHSVNNYIKVLQNKRVVIRKEGNFRVNSSIIPKIEDGRYVVAFNFKIE